MVTRSLSLPLDLLHSKFGLQREELTGTLWAFAAGVTMFSAYSVLRPVREAMGVSSGVATLPALFWATFAAIVVTQAIYSRLVVRISRPALLLGVFGSTAAILVLFNMWLRHSPTQAWIAPSYFVWVSVFNLFIISAYWSVMADVFSSAQAARIFGILAASLSLGGLIGARLATDLAVPLGTPNLLLISATLLVISGFCVRQVLIWRARSAVVRESREPEIATEPNSAAGLWQTVRTVASSRYLRCVALFVLLLSAANTVLYIEQNRLIGQSLMTPDQRTAFFGQIDFWVQLLALIGQLFLFRPLVRRLGVRSLLALTPLLMIPAFALIALAPGITLLFAAVLCRRIAEYAFTKPARDMLFTEVARDHKYSAKSLIDTLVYRGGDAVSASALQATVGQGGAGAGLAGVVICLLWVGTALRLGTFFRARTQSKL